VWRRRRPGAQAEGAARAEGVGAGAVGAAEAEAEGLLCAGGGGGGHGAPRRGLRRRRRRPTGGPPSTASVFVCVVCVVKLLPEGAHKCTLVPVNSGAWLRGRVRHNSISGPSGIRWGVARRTMLACMCVCCVCTYLIYGSRT
jgi:hypothetical protein